MLSSEPQAQHELDVFILVPILTALSVCADAERSHSSHRSYRSRPERGDSANDAELTAITSNAASLRSATAEQQRKSSVRRESVKRQSRALPCEASVTASYRRAQQEMDTAMKGMDITIMMDCTGSMVMSRCWAGQIVCCIKTQQTVATVQHLCTRASTVLHKCISCILL